MAYIYVQTLTKSPNNCREFHNIIGGLGSAVAEVLAEHRIAKLKRIGIKDTFGESGEPDQLAFKYGIDSASIENTILDWLRE